MSFAFTAGWTGAVVPVVEEGEVTEEEVGMVVLLLLPTVEVEAAEVVPIDRILTETDAPYLTPHPYRGQRNDSHYVPLIVEKLAEIKGVSPEKMTAQVAKNAEELFKFGRK